jgi:hypothetical protein
MGARHCITDRNAVVKRDEERVGVSGKFIGKHVQMSGRRRGDNLTIFREWPFFLGGNPQPDSKIMGPNEDLMRSGLLRACVSVSVVYLNYVNYRDGRNMWVTHGKYDEHRERDNSYGS